MGKPGKMSRGGGSLHHNMAEMEGRTCLGCRSVGSRQSATGARSPLDTLRVPRLRPQSLRKKRDKQTLVSLFWQGQKDLNPRHAVLEWMWKQRTESGGGTRLRRSTSQVTKRAVLVWCCQKKRVDRACFCHLSQNDCFYLRFVL